MSFHVHIGVFFTVNIRFAESYYLDKILSSLHAQKNEMLKLV